MKQDVTVHLSTSDGEARPSIRIAGAETIDLRDDGALRVVVPNVRSVTFARGSWSWVDCAVSDS